MKDDDGNKLNSQSTMGPFEFTRNQTTMDLIDENKIVHENVCIRAHPA